MFGIEPGIHALTTMQDLRIGRPGRKPGRDGLREEMMANISAQMVKELRTEYEVGDTQALKATVGRLRNIDGVFDAYRVTPGAG